MGLFADVRVPEYDLADSMRAFVLFAHPVPESFSSALHRTVVTTLSERGWEVDDCDLYAEGFDPVLSCRERRDYHDEPKNIDPVQGYVERLMAAEVWVLVFPVWIFGFPAILKGFFDRVCVPGVAFRLENGKVFPNLTHIRKLAAVTTYGGTRIRAIGAGDPPRRIVKRAVRFYCQPEKTRYLSLYDMNRADGAKRTAFLNRVKRSMQSL